MGRFMAPTLAAVLLLSTVPSAWSQTEGARLKVRAVLVDKDLNQKPVPKLAFVLAPSEGPVGETITGKTGFDGNAELQLAPGKYRLSTPEPVEFQGKRYSWEIDVAVSLPETTVELSNDNAKATEAAAPAPGRKVDELTTLFQKYQNAVVTVWSEIGHGTGFIVDSAGLIVTNQHVIGPSERISVQFDSKRKIAARLLSFNPEKDVAVLEADLKAFSEAIVAPIAKPEANHDAVIEGERVFTIGSPLSQRKILTSGIASKIEERVIISDININPGNSGGPLFNSVGQVVGITTFGAHAGSGPGISGIVRIEQALPEIDQARKKMRDVALPDARLLPVEPTDSFPLDSLKETLQAEKFDRKPYLFSEGGFDVALVSPVLKYRLEEAVNIAAAKEKGKRSKKHQAAVQNSFEPLQELKGWAEYAGEYKPVLLIQAQPQLRETFLSALGRGLAASGGSYGGPAHLRFKTDFYRMRLLCGDKEVEPIQPGKDATVVNAHNVFVNVTDATYVGFYSYPADAISPSCGRVVLQLYSEKEPDKPVSKVLDPKTVQRISTDFQPYLTKKSP
ncbi:MAG TPA: S1C family serine protease [Candidatus Acidoferrum sp.]|nr:S1C family serine protease [Candidatus Acidoferrum sp.]